MPNFPIRSIHELGVLAAAGLVFLGFASGARAQSITSVGIFPGGSNSTVAGINSNGTAATGYSNNAAGTDTTLRWTNPGASVSLGLLPSGSVNSYGEAMDSTGTIIAGYGDSGGPTRAYRWTNTGGYQVLPLVAGTGTFATANGISANGARVVGVSGFGAAARAFLWDSAVPPISNNLGVVSGQSSSAALRISGDGNVVSGYSGNFAFRWTSVGGMLSLGSLPGQVFARGEAINTDGSVIAGRYSDGNERGFRWSSATGMVALPSHPNGNPTLRPRAISGDGNVIIGQAIGACFVWTPAGGTQDLAAHLTARGVNVAGWSFTDATAINPAGTAMGGVAIFGGQSVGWVVTGLSCPTVTGSPLTVDVCPLGDITLFATGSGGSISGSGLTYAWKRNNVLLTPGIQPSGSSIASVSASSITIVNVLPGDAGTYTCLISGSGACAVTGPATTLNVYGSPTILNQPADASACIGQNPFFFAAANPANGFATYQWQKFVGPQPNLYADIFDGPTGTGSTFIGTGTTTFSVISAQLADARRYRCVISDACGASTAVITSRPLLTVNPDTAITVQPVDTAVCLGDNDAFFSVTAVPSNGVTYQWYKRQPPFPNVYNPISDGPTGNGSFYGGTQTASLTVAGVTPADLERYRCVVTGPCGLVQTSQSAALGGLVFPVIGTPPVGGLVCPNGSRTLSVALAPGSYGAVNYKWLRSIGSGPFAFLANGIQASGSVVTGATAASMTISNFKAGDAGLYRVRVEADCGPIDSAAATLTFCPVDFNCDGVRSPADIFAFLNAYFAGDPAADFDGNGIRQPADIFAFLNAYFATC